MINRLLKRLAPKPPELPDNNNNVHTQQDEAEKALITLTEYTRANRRRMRALEAERRMMQRAKK